MSRLPSRKPTAEDVERVSKCLRLIRQSPSRFRAGREFLEQRFSPKALRARGVSGDDSRIEAFEWAASLSPALSSVEAQAVILLVVAYYDEAPGRSAVLPDWLASLPRKHSHWSYLRDGVLGRELPKLRQALIGAIARMEVFVAAPRDNNRSKLRAPPKWLASAMLEVSSSPEQSDSAIADKIGVHRSQLSRHPVYKQAAALARDRGARTVRGRVRRGEDGSRSVEAIDPPEEG